MIPVQIATRPLIKYRYLTLLLGCPDFFKHFSLLSLVAGVEVNGVKVLLLLRVSE